MIEFLRRVRKDQQIRFLMPSGMGDIHWCMLKMRPLMKAIGRQGEKPVLRVASFDPDRDRTEAYVKRIEGVEWGGYHKTRDVRTYSKVCQVGLTEVNFEGMHAFWALNHAVEKGMDLADLGSESGASGCDWDYKVNWPEASAHPRPFVEMSWPDHAFYGEWRKRRGPLRDVVQSILSNTDLDILITGAKWDETAGRQLISQFDLHAHPDRIKDLSGKTTLDDLMSLKQASAGFIGFPSGSSMISHHMGKPTVSLWGPHPRKAWQHGMRDCWVNPARKGIYSALEFDASPELVLDSWRRVSGHAGLAD